MYFNADNLLNKRPELEALISINTPDVLCVTETMPKRSITPVADSELQLDSYEIHFNTNAKRGVTIYTKASLKATPCLEDCTVPNYEEHCWVTMKLKGSDSLLIGCIYRSPNSGDENNEALLDILRTACFKENPSHILICGDFNLPGIDWDDAPSTTQGPDSLNSKFIDCIQDCFLWQHVTQATHQRGAQAANILDLIFTNEENMVSNLDIQAPVGKSHHNVLLFDLQCYVTHAPSIRKSYNFKRGDFNRLRQLMGSHDFSEMERLPIDEAWKVFQNVLSTHADTCIPLIKPRTRNRPLWVNNSVLAKIKEKNQAYKQYRQTKSNQNLQVFKKLRNQVRWETRKAKRSYEKQLATNAKENSKAVFKYINSKLKTKTGIPDLDTPQGKATSDIDKANALNNFFSSVFTNENTVLPHIQRAPSTNLIADLVIAENAVERKLKNLKADKAPGPDCMHPRILKEVASEISRPVAKLMQESLRSGEVPSIWKEAHVSAIHKKGSKTTLNNYRPVSLTCQLCKVMESIIRDHLLKHCTENNIITPSQHGFVPRKSCSTQLLECLEAWKHSMKATTLTSYTSTYAKLLIPCRISVC